MDFLLTNLKPDSRDNRDYLFTCSAPVTEFPKKVDLRRYTPQVENQLTLSSCTANAGVNALEILLFKANKFVDLSRLFIYYNERADFYKQIEDKGAQLRHVFKTAAKHGVCQESIWPYIVENVNIKPSKEAYDDAKSRKVERYERIEGFSLFRDKKDPYAITLTKICLAKGYPVIIAQKLGKLFYSLRSKLEEQNYPPVDDNVNKHTGNHAMCIVGYDDNLGGFIVENSWGKNWGDNGFFLLKYDVALQDVIDAWVCTKFAGLALDDDWDWDESRKLKNYETQNLIVYYNDLKDGKVTLKSTVTGGIPPYTYGWKAVDTPGIYKDKIEENGNTATVTVAPMKLYPVWTYAVDVTDSGDPPMRVRQYFKVEVKKDNKPKPIPKPAPIPPKPEPLKPVKPKDDKKDDDKKNILPFIIGGIGAAIILGSIIYKFFVG